MSPVAFGTGVVLVFGLASLLAAVGWVSETVDADGWQGARAVARDRWVRLAGLFSLSGLALVSPVWPLRLLLGGLVLGGAIRLVGSHPGVPPIWHGRNDVRGFGEGLAARRGMTGIAGQIARVELIVLALVAPVFLFGGLWVTAALPVLPVLWAARRRARGYFVPRTPLNLSILALLLMVLVSLFATPDLRISLGKVAGLLYGICLYFALVDWDGGRIAARRPAAGFLGAGTLLAGLGLAGTAWFDKFPLFGGVVRAMPVLVRGWQGAEGGFQPNEVGGSLLWVVLPLLALLPPALRFGGVSESRLRTRTVTALVVVMAVLTSGTLILTQSRGAILGAGAGILLLVSLARPRLGSLMAAVVAMCLILAVVTDLLPGPSEVAATPDYSSVTNPANLGVRQEIWSAAVQTIARQPLIGVGMNVFRRIMALDFHSSLIPCDYDVGHAHNQMLQAALDLGVPGLIGYLALWLTAGRTAVAAWRGAREPWMRALAGGLLAAGVAFLGFGLTDAVALGAKPGLLFWAALALLVRLQHTGRTDGSVIRVVAGATLDDRLPLGTVEPELIGAMGGPGR